MGGQGSRRNSKAGTAGQRSSLVDCHVGARVRMRRMTLDMSQTDVASHLGVTYQQFQKYEAGVNRISASKLQQIGNILQVAPSFFFEELPEPDGGEASPLQEWPIMKFAATADGLALARAFGRIRDPAVRRAIITLVQELADPEE